MAWYQSEQNQATMRQYIHRDQLVGPFAAELIQSDAANRILFDYHERIYREMDRNPTFIVGRRGSGKTAYLNYLCQSSNYHLVIRLDKSEIFEDIMENLYGGGRKPLFVEKTAQHWNSLFYSLIAVELYREHKAIVCSDNVFMRFIEQLGVTSTGSAGRFLIRLLRRVKNDFDTKGHEGGFLGALFLRMYDDFDRPDIVLQERIKNICKENKIKVVLVIDSLEEYRLDSDSMKSVLAGFLKSVGSFNIVRAQPLIKCCLPSEIYYPLLSSSTNVGKDVNQPVYLHWKPMELLSVAAHRMWVHVQLYGDGDPDFNKKLLNIDISKREGVAEFFHLCFPSNLVNEVGMEERAELYILRHTQMLPRQILKIFDAVLKCNVRTTQNYAFVTSCAVGEGVQQMVNELAHGVCGAYSYQYPMAWEICMDVVRRLPSTFNQADLDSIYSKYFKNRERLGRHMSEADFSRMLTEVGCVGEVTDETDYYLLTQFEYNSIGELIFNHRAKLCVHPMFRGPRASRRGDPGIEKAVYPIGADPYESLEKAAELS